MRRADAPALIGGGILARMDRRDTLRLLGGLALTGWVRAQSSDTSGGTRLLNAPDADFAIPTKLDRVGRVIVPVEINGRGPFRLIVDTGANRSTITAAVADLIGLNYAGAPTIVLNGVTGSASVPAVEVTSMQIGDVVLPPQDVLVMQPEVLAGADGLLGIAELRDHRLYVDFEADVVTLGRGRLAQGRYYRIPAKRVAGGVLSLSAVLGRTRAVAILDTGAQATIGNRALQEAMRHDPTFVTQTSVYGTTEHVAIGDNLRVDLIAMGDLNVTRARITFGDFHIFDIWDLNHQPALLIGMDVIGVLGAIVFDYRSSEIMFRD